MGIVTVSRIELNDGIVQVMTRDGKRSELHYQQGEIGGCCAVYSVAFCMLYEQMIDDIKALGTSKGDRLLRELFNKYGMIMDGFKFKNLKTIIEKYKKKSWDVYLFDGTYKPYKQCVEGICREIDANRTPIIGVDYKDSVGGHALLAVAYEYDEYYDKPIKIFCLDPYAPTPRTSIWNSYIDIRDLRKPSTYVNDNSKCGPCKCRVADYLVFHDTDWDDDIELD